MKKMLLVAAVLLMMVGSFAVAEDLNPPPWRGLDGTTMTAWEFSTPNPDPLPDAEFNPYNPPGETAMMTVVGHSWLDLFGARQGVWELSGSMYAWLWNRPEPLPFKEIWVQITWTGPGIPIVQEIDWGAPGLPIDERPLEPGWTLSTYRIQLRPNPPYETIQISGDIAVDELVIDTRCFLPEPTSLATLGLGAVGLLLSRRRRR